MPAPGGRRTAVRQAVRAARSGRPAPTSRHGLRVDQRLWSIDPWSVLKVSALFYFCVGLIVIVAGTLLYSVGRSVGTVDQLESFVTRMGAYGECTSTDDVPEGAAFEEDEDCGKGEVLVGGFRFDDGLLLRAAAVGTTILVVAGSVGNVLLTVLLNLLNEVTGGLRHAVIREPVERPPGGSRPRAPGPGDGGGPPSAPGAGPPPTAEWEPGAGSPRPPGRR